MTSNFVTFVLFVVISVSTTKDRPKREADQPQADTKHAKDESLREGILAQSRKGRPREDNPAGFYR
jgi:hypothetical protein